MNDPKEHQKMINMEYKYDSDDVNQILNIIKEKDPPRDVFHMPPIGEQDNKLIEFLNDEKNENEKPSKRTLLIPYLIGHRADGHWVGIVVRFTNNIVQNIEYYDSMAGGSMPDKLKQELKQIYGR